MKPNILVIGDLILDHYIWGECKRISPEAPVQVIETKKENLNLGGACNVANNLVALGSNVWICGIVGEDEAGEKLVEKLQSLGINTLGIYKSKDRPTTQKSRVIASNQQVLRIDKEEKKPISKEGEEFILKVTIALLQSKSIDCIVLSDYQKGVLEPIFTQRLIALAKEADLKILIDPKGEDYSKYKGATLLTPNKKEAKEATKIDIVDEESLLKASQKLKEMCDLEYSLITLSEDGIGILKEKLYKIPTIAKEVFDVTGAGDTVIAALSYMLALKEDILESVYFANAAAAVVVSKIGSVTATKEEIYHYLQRNNLLNSKFVSKRFLEIFSTKQNAFFPLLESLPKVRNYKEKFINEAILQDFLKALEEFQKDKKVIFTNGCFDILHFGHIDYLNKARTLGDLLIVGLNSDDSIKRLKGNERPINLQEDRIALLSALECVDFVIVFNEDTPRELVAKIKPDVLVKGADYEGKVVVGSEFAKEVCLIEFQEGRSTTNLIEKIKTIK
ncbi:bifunctional heptose 7-phosphate kinase/heptose 1-phosphate adenyltransferase [Helicobacter valdiviensis]|uniref:Bifunctional protein HldE n=1 Tax=Helicobacter valdiviensis TaxID=1458358 RepID=A0A2W6MTZ4_9HELI|nr:D-glycero-beta-D-manno-heptose-7-phosphate kinase [Helicobacter valdiviensis]PZT47431.1 bifunctional heptose 7-phosphate kinase/heptose 1-phosphate adenyltransferase [Helicobacter valdiviensis]